MNSPVRKVILKKNKEEPALRRHPWIFSGAIDRQVGAPCSGDPVIVESHNGRHLGVGYFQESSIAVKLLSFFDEPSDISLQELIKKRIDQAIAYRRRLGLFSDPQTNCFRLVNAEGDQAPGLIIDRYGSTYVVQSHTRGILHQENLIAEFLATSLNAQRVISKSKETAKNDSNVVLYGDGLREDEHIEVQEHGLKFLVTPLTGQKTGFFLDQRENRQFIKSIAKGKTILNLCCYTGGFSIAALSGGASKVVSVDSSKQAIELLEQNVLLNGYSQSNHISLCEDVFEYLEHSKETFDIVICDPPAFAKHRSARNAALKGYRRLNNLALKAVKNGGQLATFSCSGIIDEQSFDSAILSSFIDQQRKAQTTKRFWQAPCHAVSIFHPESRYLKGLFIECD